MTAAAIFRIPDSKHMVRYRAEVQILDKIVGGVPKDPDTIKAWLQARLDLNDQAIRELADQTIAEMSEDRTDEDGPIPADELLDAIARKSEGGSGFKRISGQLVYEGRCLKAGLKEAANIAYPGSKYPGQREGSRKGLARTLAETVFVEDLYIPLGVAEPSGTEQRVKHVMTAQGPRSAISVVDFVEKPVLQFTVRVIDDFMRPEVWGKVWQVLENIGLGADRARSDGKFELTAWDRL